MTEPDPSVKELAANLSTEANLTADAVVVESETEGNQTFATVRTTTAAEFNREEKRKDNQARRERERWLFFAFMFFVGAAGIAGFVLAVWWENADTRRFGQAIVIAILSAGAGYLTGRAGK